MAETYAQRKNAVLKAVRTYKRSLNNLNAVLEKARREASRLSDRKTLITPESLNRLYALDDSIASATNVVVNAEATLSKVAGSYL